MKTGEDGMKRFLTMTMPLVAAVVFAGAGFARAEEAPAATPCARAAAGGCPHAAKKACAAAAEKKVDQDEGAACPCKDGKGCKCADCPCKDGKDCKCADCPCKDGKDCNCADCPCKDGKDCDGTKAKCTGCKKKGDCPRKAGS